MTSSEFCYWLQGFFELRADKEPLSIRQLVLIQRHLALVNSPCGFCAWLGGVIDTLATTGVLALTTTTQIDQRLSKAIENGLAGTFEKVVDHKV